MEKFHIPRGNHSVLKSFFLILLPHVLLLSVTCFVVHYSFVKTKNALLQNEEAFFVQKNHKFIQNTFADIVADLKILANHNHVYSQAIGREAEKKELQNLFYSFAHYKRVYDQIRFLDATGMEIVRVNFSNGTAKIVPEDSLQFKGKRYYFNDTFQLDKNEIFISPFDLNIEHGKLETPLKPMIRIGTPVVDEEGNKKGIVLLNYLGVNLLNSIGKNEGNSQGFFMLLNPQGYWLKGLQPEEEWGFMFEEDKKDLVFAKRFRESWDIVSAEHSGQFQNHEGLFTFTTVYPVGQGLVSSTGASKAYESSSYKFDSSKYYWKIVSFVPADRMKMRALPFTRGISIFFVVALLFLSIWSWLLSQAMGCRKKAEASLKKANESLEQTVQERTKKLADANAVLHEKILALQRAEEDKEKIECQLRQAQKMEAIGTLAGGIAHDFNNILTPIIGFAELAQEEIPENNPAHEEISEVLKAGKRAKDLVRQILTFSREKEQERHAVNLVVIVKEALKLLRSSLPSSIEIRTSFNQDCGLVMADPTQIHQILMNLCTNAYHAMRESGGTLGVRLAQKEIGPEDYIANIALKPGKYVLLEVSDTGHGIDQAVIDRVFEPYFTTKAESEGTGLGLSVVHGIVTSHHGHITVYSELGKGSTFHVYLPYAGGDDDAQLEFVPDEDLLYGKGERVLIVDDEEPIILMESIMLEKLGYKVKKRTSSIEALEYLKENSDEVDLLITDMTMPNMNGIVLTGKAKEIKPELPVILLTGFSEIVHNVKAEALGIKAILTKPVTKKDLAASIRKVLDGS